MTRDIFAALSAGYPDPFAVRLWDGSTWQPNPGPVPFTLALKHPGAARAMFWPFSKVGFGESYIFDDFDVEGDVFTLTGWLRHLVARQDRVRLGDKLRLLRALLRLPNQKNPRDRSKAGRPTEGDHRVAREREAISYTYDLPGEFYRLFLDRNMQYTCGYFARPDEDLDAAQERKLDYICRKLRLKPGERFIDFGCGWGNLIVFAAKHYGVEAVGITLSENQAELARKRVADAGLADRVEIRVQDYRELAGEQFDAVGSIGMVEHVGEAQIDRYAEQLASMLQPGGRLLNHGISRLRHGSVEGGPFSERYVFPDGETLHVSRVILALERAGFIVRTVEEFGADYAETLRHWIANLDENLERAEEIAGPERLRVWRLYLRAARNGFEIDFTSVYQVLCRRA
jgi:cyclopropane-fatty-acyl-phospholipid synthase